jgi:hypothetical protein
MVAGMNAVVVAAGMNAVVVAEVESAGRSRGPI